MFTFRAKSLGVQLWRTPKSQRRLPMTVPILTTKLYLPKTRPDHIPRPRLIEALNSGSSRKLTLISAPAGFGKSTLLSAWINQIENRNQIAWLSLDHGDNDLVRFLSFFIAALQTIESDVAEGTLIAMQSAEAINLEALLTNLINEIAEISDDVILILDDYHVIEFHPIDQALSFLLDHLPDHMHLVIASRIDPSIPLARLRARGQMVEIRADDLRFSFDEANLFLNQVMAMDLLDKDVAALGERTEGWVVGLQLAAISMQGLEGEGLSKFVRRFTGSNRYIQDYLVDEVLGKCSEETKEFLLKTSILGRMCAALSDFVLEISDSQMILEQLEASNLFIVPLDHQRQWYRYHHLFADLLKHRLRLVYPKKIAGIHRRSSKWYQSEGQIDEAIQHAQAANDIGLVVEILEKNWQGLVHRGELTKMKQLLDGLGPGITRKSAPLSMAYCWLHNLTRSPGAIPEHIQDIRKIWQRRSSEENARQPIHLAVIPSLVETMEAVVALEDSIAEKAKDHAKRAIELIPEDPNPATRGLLHSAAGFRLAQAHAELGENERACTVLLEILAMLKNSKNYVGVANTIYQLVTIYQQTNQLHQAMTLCEDSLAFIEQHQWDHIPPSGMVYLILAELMADSGKLDGAKTNFEIGQRLVEPMMSPRIQELLVRVEEKLGDTTRAIQTLVEPLSEREIEVLQLIAQGLTNRQIGERLYLALDTVKGHNRRIFGKMGVQNRTEAVLHAGEMELL
jgi:LuxR family transcriptional regulator, maltose regulon positive regulatory protein